VYKKVRKTFFLKHTSANEIIGQATQIKSIGKNMSKKRTIKKIGLYGILTNPKPGYLKVAQAMADKKLSFIQLRMKNHLEQEILTVAKQLRKIIGPESIFIINDSPHIAAEVGADGVHLGQSDMSIEEARKIVGPDAIIGLSTHNPEQTIAACKKQPDYIGVGPVFPTPTKKIPDPAIGFDGMKKMLELATVPAVVLGGINHSNIQAVLDNGANSVCAVRCINASDNPKKEIDRLLEIIG